MYSAALLLFCGLALVNAAALNKLRSRIVNGEDAAPGEIPYQVSLQVIRTGQHFCGGAILNKDYVITAAHCVSDIKPEDIMIIAGTVNLQLPHSAHLVKTVQIHERYDLYDSLVNDIALIKVEQPFIISDVLSTVTLPTPEDVLNTDDVGTVSGFGRLKVNERGGSKLLQRVNIRIADQDYCRRMYEPLTVTVYSTQFCANDRWQNKGSCKGDSGGPLIVNGKLAGLVSWAKDCALLDYPTVYTRVSAYLDWIKKHAA
ncbi:hypothetical protein KM043_016222 [Ampulex compressa]|nr:hypothetical protein KM043_016222 [Ampulex compressa]